MRWLIYLLLEILKLLDHNNKKLRKKRKKVEDWQKRVKLIISLLLLLRVRKDGDFMYITWNYLFSYWLLGYFWGL